MVVIQSAITKDFHDPYCGKKLAVSRSRILVIKILGVTTAAAKASVSTHAITPPLNKFDIKTKVLAGLSVICTSAKITAIMIINHFNFIGITSSALHNNNLVFCLIALQASMVYNHPYNDAT